MSGLSVYEVGASGQQHPAEAMEHSARHLDRMMNLDAGTASLSDRLASGGVMGGSGSVSGLQDRDYPAAGGSGPESVALRQRTKVSRVPLPAELVDHFGHMQCNCSMGLFSEVERAWLTIDSDIYVWRYEDGGDLAYYDGLTDTILNVALVTPKPGILQPHIKYLLCLATPVEIVLLGVSFSSPPSQPGSDEEMHLLPEPLFSLPSDQLQTSSVVGSSLGRIFLGGRDGHLHEFVYQAEVGWFGEKTKRINHSSSSLAWILPSFLGSFSEDAVMQLIVDNSRNILYTRSDKGTITVWDLGRSGQDTERVVTMTANSIIDEASKFATTVEASNFKPLVHIAVVPLEEDPIVHLVVLTGSGARLYFSTKIRDDNSAESRPQGLRLLHVRLPPGFSPSAPPQRPTKVHTGFYRSGLSLLASSPAEAADVLWLVWGGGLPPGAAYLMEGQDTVPVEGHTWAMDEIVKTGQLEKLQVRAFGGREPPCAVTQHCSSARQLVVLSAHGTLLISPFRPVDLLRQLLIECGGPDAEPVRAYFTLQGGEQACATALVLATSQALLDRQLAEWATRAFILHGGEPRLIYPTAAQNQGTGVPYPHAGQYMSPGQQTFLPAVMSTPGPATPTFSSPYHAHQPLPELQFSARNSSVCIDLNLCQSSRSGPQSQALVREKQSLMVVRNLLNDSLQLLGLWSIVVEHQVINIVTKLPADTITSLRQATFRDLVVRGEGREVASTLVHCLVDRYLSDNASTDPISSRLRNVCPGLYTEEDSTSSKVHELLLVAAQQSKTNERERMVGEAMALALPIAGRLQLGILVSHLSACQAFSRVVEICLAAAGKRDPSNLALHFYKNGENPDDSAGMAAFQARASCYTHVTSMLATLLSASKMCESSPSVPIVPGPPPPTPTASLPPSLAKDSAEKVFQLVLASSDQLMHVTLYQWLVAEKATDRLLNVKSPYIEEFLKMGTTQNPETMAMYDLLWKYYEKNNQYVAAAKILSKLAERHSTELNLAGRVSYLSRAIMCVKSSEGAGELLHHLEEKMEVARVQLTVLEAVSANPELATPERLARLNSDLVDITALYQDWAEPHNLWECKLAILQCAGHPDPMLVNNIWSKIIEEQMTSTGLASNQTRLAALRQKLDTLGRLYASSGRYFPIEMLVQKLEVISCKEGGDPGWIPSCLQNVGVSIARLLDVYNRLYTARDPIWLTTGDELHVLKVLSALLAVFASNPGLVPLAERRQFTVVCQDAVSTYLGDLYMRQTQETTAMVSTFRDIQAKLDRI